MFYLKKEEEGGKRREENRGERERRREVSGFSNDFKYLLSLVKLTQDGWWAYMRFGF